MLTTGLFIGLLVGVALCVPFGVIAMRRAERRARIAERRARSAERMAEIGAMTGGLAHEIKNPLSTIGLNAQLLGEAIGDLPVEPADRERLTRRIGVLRREIDRLKDILEGFLRFAGSIRLERRPTDLNVVVEEIGDFFLPQAQRHAVRLRMDLSRSPVMASVDAAQLKQALLNLMLNAVQAMSRGDSGAAPGEEAPDTSRSGGSGGSGGAEGAQRARASGAARELILRTETAKDATGQVARIHIIDTGPGIPPENRERIFTPYFSTRSGGSGLGLPISRRIVEEHAGRIEVESEEGKGADFIITLPRGD